jgi:hypothetical protein
VEPAEVIEGEAVIEELGLVTVGLDQVVPQAYIFGVS